MKKMIAVVMIVALFTTGCTGSFNLTRKVYNFHRSQTDKWSDELCFLLVVLIPVYSIATFADAIVFNSIEFWTGKNPVDMAANTPNNVRMAYNRKTGGVLVTALAKGNHGVIFEKTDSTVIAKNEKGQVLYSSVQNQDGGVSIYDAKGKLVKNYPAGQIAMLKERYMTSNN